MRRHLRAPILITAALIVAVGVLLAFEGRDRILAGDEWGYAQRLAMQPLGQAFFDPPPGKYLIPLPLLAYWGLFEVFGLDTSGPYRLAGIAMHLTICALFFVLARRRTSDWVALIAVSPLLVLSAAAPQVLFGPIRLPMLIAIACGLIAIIGLDRRDRLGDAIACVALVGSVLSHPVSIAFIAGTGVRTLLEGPRLLRSWVYVIPLLPLLAFTFLGETAPGDRSLSVAAEFVLVNAGGTAATIVAALGPSGGADRTVMAVVGGVVLLAAAAVVWRSRGRLGPAFWAALAMPLVLWAITGIAPGAERGALAARHLYPAAVLVLFAACEVARAYPPGRRLRVALGIVASLILAVHVTTLIRHDPDAGERSRVVQAALGALEIGQGTISDGFRLTDSLALNRLDRRIFRLRADEYWAIARRFGTPAFSPERLADGSKRERSVADRILVEGLGVSLQPAAGRSGERPLPRRLVTVSGARVRSAEGCTRVQPTEEVAYEAIVILPPELGLVIDSELAGEVGVSVARFSTTGWVRLDQHAGSGELAIPRGPQDPGRPQWRARIESAKETGLCRTAG